MNVTFQSGNSETYTIAAGANQAVERDIQRETHTEVDPITGFSASEGGHTSNADFTAANGIEVRTYNVAAQGVATQV